MRKEKSPRLRFLKWILISAVLTGAAFAIQYGEDGQLGNDRPISKAVFLIDAGTLFYALTCLPAALKRRRQQR